MDTNAKANIRLSFEKRHTYTRTTTMIFYRSLCFSSALDLKHILYVSLALKI